MMTDLQETRREPAAPECGSVWSAAGAVLAVVAANLALFAIPAVILLAPTRRAEAEQPAPVPEPAPYVVPVSLAWMPTPVREAKPLIVRRSACDESKPGAPVKIARRAQRVTSPHSL